MYLFSAFLHAALIHSYVSAASSICDFTSMLKNGVVVFWFSLVHPLDLSQGVVIEVMMTHHE
jgi:hypothetical protein